MIELNIDNKNIIYSDSFLSVIKKADRFFYGIFDKDHTLREASLAPVDISQIESLILKGCSKKQLSVHSPSLHLPEGIHGMPLLDKYTNSLPHSVYFKDRITGDESYTHYGLQRNSAEHIGELFSEKEVNHLSTAIINYLYPAMHDKVFVLIGSGYMYFCYYTPMGLRLINSYDYYSDCDVIYYLNLCMSFLDLDPVECKVEIGGRVTGESQLDTMFSDYLGNWHYSDPAMLTIDESGVNIEKHIFQELYISYLCGL